MSVRCARCASSSSVVVDVAGDVEVEVAVAVGVEERAAGAPAPAAVRRPLAATSSNVPSPLLRKRTFGPSWSRRDRAGRRRRKSPAQTPLPQAARSTPGLLRHVLERPVALVAIERVPVRDPLRASGVSSAAVTR